MREFQVYVMDDRYSVPTLYIIQAASPTRACELAEGIFTNSLHHRGVELFDGDLRILALGVAATTDEVNRLRRPASGPPQV